jgi:hypothetical protein
MSFWSCFSYIHMSLNGRSLEDTTELRVEENNPEEEP